MKLTIFLCFIGLGLAAKDDASLRKEFHTRLEAILKNATGEFTRAFEVGSSMSALKYLPRYVEVDLTILDNYAMDAYHESQGASQYNTSYPWYVEEQAAMAMKQSVQDIMEGAKALSYQTFAKFQGWSDGTSAQASVKRLEADYLSILANWKATTDSITEAIHTIFHGSPSQRSQVLSQLLAIGNQARHLGTEAMFALEDEYKNATSQDKLVSLPDTFALRHLQFVGENFHNFNEFYLNLLSSMK